MKIQTTLQGNRIQMAEPTINDVYFIEQGENGRFYVTSENGYNGYEGEGHATLEAAIKSVKTSIKNYFTDRCL